MLFIKVELYFCLNLLKLILQKKLFIKELSKALLKLIIAGIVIGVLKEYDLIIALLLILKIAFNSYTEIVKPEEKNYVLLIGMILTGFGGIVGETWGVMNGFWEYHEVNRAIPLWVPFAWMLAFHYLYKVEKRLIPTLKNPTQANKIILAIILALILPAFGEVITIYLGVWTYYWPYQILGVPLYAFACLLFVHMLVYTILHFICKKYNLKDIVYY